MYSITAISSPLLRIAAKYPSILNVRTTTQMGLHNLPRGICYSDWGSLLLLRAPAANGADTQPVSPEQIPSTNTSTSIAEPRCRRVYVSVSHSVSLDAQL